MVTQRTLAKLGNKTRYGHIVSASSTIFDEDHNPLVRGGDKAWCDVCKGAFEINATYTGLLEAGFIAGDGDLVLCHCKDNFVIAISGFTGERHPGIMSAKPAAFGIDPEQQTQQEPEQHAQTAKKKRTGIDAGFCVVPQQSTTESFKSVLFAGGQPEGTRELYRSLNGASKEYKAGSILLVVDPDKQDSDQIAHMQAAKQRIDTALAPLSHQQANFLFKHKDTIEMFAAAATTANDAAGYSGKATEAAKGYFEQVEKILVEIEKTYKNQYIISGTLIGEQFFVERRRLFGQLDSVLKMFMKHRFMFNEYTDLKSALGLSSRSITHRWNETGVSDIEGYATHIEKLAKYVKWMETAGKIGIGLSALDTAAKITEACTVGRDCAKTSFTSIGEFAGSLAGGALASRIIQGSAASSICSGQLKLATVLEFFQYRFSDSFGGNPPLYSCGLSAL